MYSVEVWAQLPKVIASGWAWEWMTEPLGVEQIRGIDELPAVLRAFGRALAIGLKASRVERFALSAYQIGGGILGRDVWLRDSVSGLLVPHGEPWCLDSLTDAHVA